MTSYRLTYFDFDGGRGEPVRIALHAAGIAFEDRRLSFAEFGEARAALRFNAVPVLTIDGDDVTQSNAILRYVGKLAKLYPEDPLQALYCDEAMGAVEDLANQVRPTFFLEGDALKDARAKLVEGPMPRFLGGLNELLVRGGGSYFADQRPTIADLKVFVQTRWLRSGALDHVPADTVDKLAPELAAHQQRIADEPMVKAYYASRI